MTTIRRQIVVPGERELVITRLFNAPRELVFSAWTDPRHAALWSGPVDHPATHVEMDARAGAGATASRRPRPAASFGMAASSARSPRRSASSSRSPGGRG